MGHKIFLAVNPRLQEPRYCLHPARSASSLSRLIWEEIYPDKEDYFLSVYDAKEISAIQTLGEIPSPDVLEETIEDLEIYSVNSTFGDRGFECGFVPDHFLVTHSLGSSRLSEELCRREDESKYNKFSDRFQRLSTEELVTEMKRQRQIPGWVSARGDYLVALREALENRNIDPNSLLPKKEIDFPSALENNSASTVTAEITVEWGYEEHSIVVTAENWERIKSGEPVHLRGEGYYHEGEFFQDEWFFGGGVDGTLEVSYGDDGGVGYAGSLAQAIIKTIDS